MKRDLEKSMLSVLRIAAAFMFVTFGAMKVLALPTGPGPAGAAARFLSFVWFGGLLELVGGGMMLVGLFTRPVAFVLSGEMAVAYFTTHFPLGFWPTLNGGVPAALYSFLWLYFSVAGGGAWSLDAVLERRLAANAKPK